MLSTPGEDTVTLALSTWLVGGLFLDGYAHTYVIDTATEDFFTPWHAVFYAGFAALAAWIAWMGYRRRRPAGSVLDWFPAGYRLAVIGLVVFAAGGVGDGIWHTVFGVEVGIDALLSPTHLLLFVGGMLLLWTPVRASARRGDRSSFLALGAVTLVTGLLVFLVQYLWLLPYPWFAQQRYVAASGEGSGNVQVFLAGAIVSTALLLGPLLLVARRWSLPFGATTAVWTVVAILESLAFSQRYGAIAVVAAGGLAHDAVLAMRRDRADGPMAAAFAGPAVLFAAYLVYARIDGPLRWPAEIWGGLIVMAGFTGAGLVLLQRSGAGPPTPFDRRSGADVGVVGERRPVAEPVTQPG